MHELEPLIDDAWERRADLPNGEIDDHAASPRSNACSTRSKPARCASPSPTAPAAGARISG